MIKSEPPVLHSVCTSQYSHGIPEYCSDLKPHLHELPKSFSIGATAVHAEARPSLHAPAHVQALLSIACCRCTLQTRESVACM